jgi:uncharacterized protein (TIGR03435 family)
MWAVAMAGLGGLGAFAQPVAFEVASVKTAVTPERQPIICLVPCTVGERLTVVGSRVDIRFMSISKLILTAYGIKPHQLSGPDWMRSQRFDILAKMPEGVARDRIPEMLQALLAERFKLSIHRDSKEQPVYALVVGKNGAKIKESTEGEDVPLPDRPGSRALYTPQGEARMEENGDVMVSGGPLGPIRGGRGADGAMQMEMLRITMAGLAELVAPHVDRPVVDMTGLMGNYQFVWKLPMPGPGGGGRRGPGDGPGENHPEPAAASNPFDESMFKAIENVGLKLEARKASVEMMVVDRVEKTPTEN